MKEKLNRNKPQQDSLIKCMIRALEAPGVEINYLEGDQRIFSVSLSRDPVSDKLFLLIRNISEQQLITRLGGNLYDDLGGGFFGIDIQQFALNQELKKNN